MVVAFNGPLLFSSKSRVDSIQQRVPHEQEIDVESSLALSLHHLTLLPLNALVKEPQGHPDERKSILKPLKSSSARAAQRSLVTCEQREILLFTNLCEGGRDFFLTLLLLPPPPPLYIGFLTQCATRSSLRESVRRTRDARGGRE